MLTRIKYPTLDSICLTESHTALRAYFTLRLHCLSSEVLIYIGALHLLSFTGKDGGEQYDTVLAVAEGRFRSGKGVSGVR
jgi:hypothetical protein